jgi:hypothetical protein
MAGAEFWYWAVIANLFAVAFMVAVVRLVGGLIAHGIKDGS